MDRQHTVFALLMVSACASIVMLLAFVTVALPEHRAERDRLDSHIDESEQIHDKITAFMQAGPRYSRREGLEVCLAVLGLYEQAGVSTTLECR